MKEVIADIDKVILINVYLIKIVPFSQVDKFLKKVK